MKTKLLFIIACSFVPFLFSCNNDGQEENWDIILGGGGPLVGTYSVKNLNLGNLCTVNYDSESGCTSRIRAFPGDSIDFKLALDEKYAEYSSDFCLINHATKDTMYYSKQAPYSTKFVVDSTLFRCYSCVKIYKDEKTIKETWVFCFGNSDEPYWE